MRLAPAFALSALASAWALPAAAQSELGNPVAIPPAPPVVAAPQQVTPAPPQIVSPPPPGLVQTPLPPDEGADSDTGLPVAPPAGSNNGSTGGPTTAQVPPPVPPPPAWLPRDTAVLGALNKLDDSVSQTKIPVGGTAAIGDLNVSVLSCLVRSPGAIPDTAVFVAVTPVQDQSQPTYRGWMVQSAPGAAVVGDATETFRIVGCS